MSDTPYDPGGPNWPPDDPDIPTHTDTDDEELVFDLTGRRRFLGGKRLVGAAIGAVVLVGAGAAFGLTSGDDGGSSESATGDDSGSGDPMADAYYDYAGCMRENGLEDWPDPMVDEDGGVDMDPGGGDAYDLDDPDVEAANEECQAILDDAESANAGPGLTPEEQAERQDQTLAMAQCMRDRGWDFPDPEISEDGGNVGISVGPDANLPEEGEPDFDQFEQDHEECNEEAGLPTEDDEDDGSD